MSSALIHQDSDSALPCPLPPPTLPAYPPFPPLGLALTPGLNMGTGKPGMGGHHLLMPPGSQVGTQPWLQAAVTTSSSDCISLNYTCKMGLYNGENLDYK